MVNRKLKTNLNNWILDRAKNREPLMLGQFKKFHKDLGYNSKDINVVLRPKAKIKVVYKKTRAKYN